MYPIKLSINIKLYKKLGVYSICRIDCLTYPIKRTIELYYIYPIKHTIDKTMYPIKLSINIKLYSL